MKALTIVPGAGQLGMGSRPEPEVTRPDDVLLDVLQVGICGTDRDEVSGGRADAAPGKADLVIGHEMVGRVVAVGPAVVSARRGDFAVLTVRRECRDCPSCASGRPDMCYSGDYTERGIKGEDGYQTERVVDRERYVIVVPAGIAGTATLVEPLSVAEKAIDEALSLQAARLSSAAGQSPWCALVAGLGPVGLLAGIALRLRGARLVGLDVVDAGNPRAQLFEAMGGVYVDGRSAAIEQLDDRFGRVDIIFEAAGVAALEFDLLNVLGVNGIYVLTGIASGTRPVTVDGATLMRKLVLGNQLMVGSVNASRTHFEMAVKDLERAEQRWPGIASRIITERVPAGDFQRAFADTNVAAEIKTVIEWQRPG